MALAATACIVQVRRLGVFGCQRRSPLPTPRPRLPPPFARLRLTPGQVVFAANTMIFALAGVVAHRRIYAASFEVTAAEWGRSGLIFLATNAARAATIALLFPALRRMGYGMTWREAAVLAYGGLRGAIGVALALVAEEDAAIPLGVRALLAFHVAGACA